MLCSSALPSFRNLRIATECDVSKSETALLSYSLLSSSLLVGEKL
jgi:hypothetical protein